MSKYVEYKGKKYFLHSSQKYYYCSPNKEAYSRALHRQIWHDHYGPIPKGLHVHHKDADTENNDISNFELLSSAEHARLHSIEKKLTNPDSLLELARVGREYAKIWHSSPEGLMWHRQHAENIGLGQRSYCARKCKVCSITYQPKNNVSRFCSEKCKSRWRRDSGIDDENRNCPTCRRDYLCNRYSRQTYCSRKCAPAPNPYGQKGKPVLV